MLNPTESVCETIAQIEEWCIATLSKNPTTLLGVQMTPEQVRERYVSCIKTSDKGGYKTLRMKMNRSGRYALQCFTPEKEKREHPETRGGCTVRVRIVFKGLWLMGKDYGTLFECTHAMIQEGGGDECPF